MTEEVRIIIRVASDNASSFLRIVEPVPDGHPYEVVRVSDWRSAEIPWSEILISLSSAGSVSAIASVIKTYLTSTRAEVEVINEITGKRVKYQGPAAQIPIKQLDDVVAPDGGLAGETDGSGVPSSD